MGKKTLISTLARPCLIFEMEIWIHFLQQKKEKVLTWLVFDFWFKKHLPCEFLNKNFGQIFFFILVMLVINAFIKFVDGFDYHKNIYKLFHPYGYSVVLYNYLKI